VCFCKKIDGEVSHDGISHRYKLIPCIINMVSTVNQPTLRQIATARLQDDIRRATDGLQNDTSVNFAVRVDRSGNRILLRSMIDTALRDLASYSSRESFRLVENVMNYRKLIDTTTYLEHVENEYKTCREMYAEGQAERAYEKFMEDVSSGRLDAVNVETKEHIQSVYESLAQTFQHSEGSDSGDNDDDDDDDDTSSSPPRSRSRSPA